MLAGSRLNELGGWVLAVLAVLPTSVLAQAPDSIRPVELAPVVVTAERVRTPLASSTATVARLGAEELGALPLRSVAEALATLPGLTFLDLDGTGFDPQLATRGFYGGGEAEYVQVLLDGRPLNGLESGLVDWDLVPLGALASIEVLRGGASSLYGDAAVGGVINLVSGGGPRRAGASLAGGGLGTLRGSFDLRSAGGSGFGSFRRTDGFRQHGERSAASAGASYRLAGSGRGELSLSTLHHWRRYQEPGPLTAAELAASRTEAQPFYRFDGAEERLHRLGVEARRTLGARAEVAGYLAGELRALEAVRTLPLSPDFADTRERRLATARLLGSAQLSRDAAGGTLLLGADWSAGRLANEHYAMVTGDAAAYAEAAGGRGELDAEGDGSRLAAAGFARYELRAGAALRMTAGARVDWLRDAFEETAPGAGVEHRNTHVAVSPQGGLNLRWLRSARHESNVYLNAGRSFKAPTPDQLFDQRSIPAPFPPYRLRLSNPDLVPARGVSYEAGLYHRAVLVPGSLSAALSLAVYQSDMEDELDIDLQSYRYVNIGRSRHRGLEAGLKLDGRALGAHASYTLQDATFRYGEYRGNSLKAIPRHALAAGLRLGSADGLAGSLAAHGARGIRLDDANTIDLPGWLRVDGRLSYPAGRLRLELEVFNLLDREYSTTGYPDPAGSGLVYYHPAAGRVLQAGVTAGW